MPSQRRDKELATNENIIQLASRLKDDFEGFIRALEPLLANATDSEKAKILRIDVLLLKHAYFTTILKLTPTIIGYYTKNDDMGEKRKCYTLMAVAYFMLAQYQNAIDHYEKALAIAKSRMDLPVQARCNMNIGNIYARMRQFKEALQYYETANAIFQYINDKDGRANGYWIAGKLHERQSQYQIALQYYEKARHLPRIYKILRSKVKFFEISQYLIFIKGMHIKHMRT